MALPNLPINDTESDDKRLIRRLVQCINRKNEEICTLLQVMAARESEKERMVKQMFEAEKRRGEKEGFYFV